MIFTNLFEMLDWRKKKRKTDSMSVSAWGSETPAAGQVVLNNFTFKDLITIWLKEKLKQDKEPQN